MKLLVTGGLGFIGSHFVRTVLSRRPSWKVVNIDKQTYAGNPENLAELGTGSKPLPYKEPCAPSEAWNGARYQWVKADICDNDAIEKLMAGADAVVHLAAETHVDRSILSSADFLQTNVMGSHTLLEAAKRHKIKRFVQVGTDEVYGSVERGASREDDPLLPNSPYSSSKAAGDLLARSYFVTHGLNVMVTRASNNFGPNQFPEKALPLLVTNALENRPYPLYGDGKQVRDWLYAPDHAEALLIVLEKGEAGEIYNIGGMRSLRNIDLVRRVLKLMGKPESLIQPVADRLGHDRRYALSCAKIQKLGWKPRHSFESALQETINWYSGNEAWWRPLKEKSGFKNYYHSQYGKKVWPSKEPARA